MFPVGVADEGADAADGQSLPSEGIEQEAAVILPLAALSELGPGKSPTCHHLPHLTVPRPQRPLKKQPVSLSQDTPTLSSHSPQSFNMGHWPKNLRNPAGAYSSFQFLKSKSDLSEHLFCLFLWQPAVGRAGPDTAGAPDCGGALHPALHQEHLEEQLPTGRPGGGAPPAGLL